MLCEAAHHRESNRSPWCKTPAARGRADSLVERARLAKMRARCPGGPIQLHPAEWERLIQVAPPDATGEDVASMGPPLSNEAGANVGIVPIACRGAR